MRPFGAIVFGRLGDLVGRKYTFLVTILIMGLSTFLVAFLPTYASWGIAAPIVLIGLRLLQGLALGGEYGGAATYVAEHAPHAKRGAYTAWIQTTAAVGLMLALRVILGTRLYLGEKDFTDWGWRIPYALSGILLAISVWIRLKLNESPAFARMKSEGKTSKAPLTESFGNWDNLKIVLLALIGATAGQAVVWYTGQFYALFFLQSFLKVDGPTANVLIAISLIVGQGRRHLRQRLTFMWKIMIGFAAFAGLAMWIFVKSGADVHIGGEQHDVSAGAAHAPASTASK